MADDGPAWHGWTDDNGDAMFVADGQKSPVLVRVTEGGAQEDVLAVFTSIETASIFQEWFDRSFEDTALSNQQLSMALHGVPPESRFYGHQSGVAVDDGTRIPGLVPEGDDD